MRRIAYVLMTWDVMLAAAGPHPYVVTSTLPKDAKVSHVVLFPETRTAQVYFESDALEPVPEGGLIPEFPVTLTTHYQEPVAV